MVFNTGKTGLKRSLPLIENSRKVLSENSSDFNCVCAVVRQDEGGKQ